MARVTVPHEGGEKGINTDLVCSWEADKDGNAAVRTMDGHHVTLKPDQWKLVASALRPELEPHAADSKPGGSPPPPAPPAA